MGKTAIIIGATGSTGKNILESLIRDDRYHKIKLFSRATCGIQHPKVEEHLGNLFELHQFTDDFTADELYCCIGTTKKQTPDENLYRKIDFGIPIAAAQLAKKNDIPTFLVMSSMGANSNSTTFYTKTKGQMENEVSKTFIKRTFIFRPSLLIRKTKESRVFESLAVSFMNMARFIFIGSMRKYRAIKTETVALAMIRTANSKEDSKRILSDEIQSLGS
tara:strand:- start:2891 stop:3547 length:657 start_codon:yes stop_codon:yes gene_type:complete